MWDKYADPMMLPKNFLLPIHSIQNFFIFRLYDDLSKDDVADVIDGLSENYDRIVNDLDLDAFPRTHFHLSFYREQMKLVYD